MLVIPDVELEATIVRHARATNRVRLAVAELVGDPELGRRIEQTVRLRPDVIRVEASARSGRVLIELVPHAPIPGELAHAARRAASPRHVLSDAHARDADRVLQLVGSSTVHGLSPPEVALRLATYGPNLLDRAEPVSRIRQLASQLRNLPSVLLLGSAAFSLVLGDLIDASAIATVIGLNAVIGYRMERASEDLLASWRDAEVGTAEVIRDGRLQTVRASGLVPGDLLVVRAGNVISADARVVEARQLAADEAALTGESEPVTKAAAAVAHDAPVAERTSMLYRGTSIASGHGRAVVVGTGATTELAGVQRLAAAHGPKIRLQDRLDRLTSRLAWTGVGASLISAIGSLAWRRPVAEVLRGTIALAVASIPEGMPVTATAALVRAMARMRERGIVVRRLGIAEALGGVTFACADKTGTLTENRMRVEVLWVQGRTIRASEVAGTAAVANPITALLAAAVLNSDLDYHPNGAWLEIAGSATERALARAAELAGLDPRELRARYPRQHLVERTDETLYVITEHTAPDGTPMSFIKGAPEQVLELCNVDGALHAENRRLAAEGLRVLAVGFKLGDGAWQLLGMIGLRDPLRPGSADAVRAAARAGIRTVMLTGDQRATATAIARQVGLAGEVVEGKELAAVLADPDRLRRISVVARVTPADKVAVVEALRRAGEVVVMAGDGINDAPALRAADVGVAVGARSTDLARHTADIVLERADLRAILEAVAEGRIVQDNLRRSIRFIAAGNLGELLLFVATSLAGRRLIAPLGLLWINLLTDTLPGLALAIEPGDPSVLDRPPAPPRAPILDRGDWKRVARDGAVIGAASGLAAVVGGPLAAFAAVGATQFGYAAMCRAPDSPPGRYFAAMIGGSAALHLAAVATAPIRGLLRLRGSLPVSLASFGVAIGTPLYFAWRASTRHEITRRGKDRIA
ncbi:MAG: cation transporter family ATPase [Myxococcales bacterium]|nr:cation transporter family ATPase [Myxococcales bacterium]